MTRPRSPRKRTAGKFATKSKFQRQQSVPGRQFSGIEGQRTVGKSRQNDAGSQRQDSRHRGFTRSGRPGVVRSEEKLPP